MLPLNAGEQYGLIAAWLGILYGKESGGRAKLNQRIKAIEARQAKANRAFHKGDHYASHLNFGSPIDALIRELTAELPAYHLVAHAGRRTVRGPQGMSHIFQRNERLANLNGRVQTESPRGCRRLIFLRGLANE